MRALAIAVALACVAASGCAMTLAVGEHATAALRVPPAASCAAAPAPAVLGTRTETREERTGKLGPDDVVTVTTSEPVAAPAPEPVAVAESRGAKVSDAGASLLGKLFSGLKLIGCVATLGTVCGL